MVNADVVNAGSSVQNTPFFAKFFAFWADFRTSKAPLNIFATCELTTKTPPRQPARASAYRNKVRHIKALPETAMRLKWLERRNRYNSAVTEIVTAEAPPRHASLNKWFPAALRRYRRHPQGTARARCLCRRAAGCARSAAQHFRAARHKSPAPSGCGTAWKYN